MNSKIQSSPISCLKLGRKEAEGKYPDNPPSARETAEPSTAIVTNFKSRRSVSRECGKRPAGHLGGKKILFRKK